MSGSSMNVGQGVDEGFVGWVVFVEQEMIEPAWGDHAEEGVVVLARNGLQGELEILKFAGEVAETMTLQRTIADEPDAGGHAGRCAAARPREMVEVVLEHLALPGAADGDRNLALLQRALAD